MEPNNSGEIAAGYRRRAQFLQKIQAAYHTKGFWTYRNELLALVVTALLIYLHTRELSNFWTSMFLIFDGVFVFGLLTQIITWRANRTTVAELENMRVTLLRLARVEDEKQMRRTSHGGGEGLDSGSDSLHQRPAVAEHESAEQFVELVKRTRERHSSDSAVNPRLSESVTDSFLPDPATLEAARSSAITGQQRARHSSGSRIDPGFSGKVESSVFPRLQAQDPTDLSKSSHSSGSRIDPGLSGRVESSVFPRLQAQDPTDLPRSRHSSGS